MAWFARIGSCDSHKSGHSRESEVQVIRANRVIHAIKTGVSIANDSRESRCESPVPLRLTKFATKNSQHLSLPKFRNCITLNFWDHSGVKNPAAPRQFAGEFYTPDFRNFELRIAKEFASECEWFCEWDGENFALVAEIPCEQTFATKSR